MAELRKINILNTLAGVRLAELAAYQSPILQKVHLEPFESPQMPPFMMKTTGD
ncbi:hypothetical protein E4U46_000888 [Claviceps purpurea]|nr:hypothetical protein E4U46_000888 [Claviceps purpurea]